MSGGGILNLTSFQEATLFLKCHVRRRHPKPYVMSAGGILNPTSFQEATLCLIPKPCLQEALPRGMRISSIGNGHVNMSFPGYYTAVLTLAEAPPVQADQVSQPGQDEARTGHLQSPLGLPSEPQQQPGPDHAAAIALRTDAQTQEAPHQEKYRWRMLLFELLPSFEREVLTVEQQSGLQIELEFQMWQAADLRAQHSMAATQRAQQTQHGADTAQSGPSEAAPEPSQQLVTARVESSAREESSQPLSHDHGAESHEPQPGQDPKVPPHPLQVLHNVLAGIAGKLVLHEVHGRLRQMLDDKGRWARLLKLNAAAVLPNGIRQVTPIPSQLPVPAVLPAQSKADSGLQLAHFDWQ